jgi:hypothetical protein|tara:strand:+ start:462 stop:752 length:291 start_codon:yes stop_codon:yes gene_type:complete
MFEKGAAACNVSYDKGELNKTTCLRPKTLNSIIGSCTELDWLNPSQLAEILQASRITGLQKSAVIVVDAKGAFPKNLEQSLQSYGFYPVSFEETLE